MTTAQLRPDSTFVAPFSVVGAAASHIALSDNNDGSYIINSLVGFTRVSLNSVTIPAGSVFKSATLIVRAQQNGTPDAGKTPTCLGGFSIGNTQSFADYTFQPYGAGFSNISQTLSQNLAQSQLDDLAVYVQNPGSLPPNSWGCQVSEVYVNVAIADPPTAPTWTGPGASTTTTLRPTFSWTHNQGDQGSGQTWFQVRVFTLAQATIGGFNPETSPATIDTGAVQSGTSAYAPTTDLSNGVTYRAYVRTWQTTHGVNQVSPWSALVQTAIAIPVPTPTAVTPSTTQTTSRPALNATVAAMTGGVLTKRQWDFANDSGFTVNLTTVVSSTLANGTSTAEAFPALPARLAQGTWFVRCRAIDSFGVAGSFSAATSFAISHPPSTSSRSPNSAVSLVYTGTTFSPTWVFQDPDPEDFQTKYEAELWKLNDPVASLKTTGVVTSGNGTGTWTGLDATWKDTELRWRVRVTDQDNITGAYSADQAFYLRDTATLNITFPTEGQVITTAQPNITWTFTASGGRTQSSSRVVVTNTSTNAVVADSGIVAGAGLSYAVPSPVILVGTNYSVTLTTVDSTGLTAVETNAFTATYVLPTTPTFVIDGSEFAAMGRVFIDWSAAMVDGTNVGWRVLRRPKGYSTWTEIAAFDTHTLTFMDYLAPSDVDLEYTVVQVALSFGDPVESSYLIKDFWGESTEYMLVCPDNPELNLILFHVTADDFGDEQEMATINLIGRGRRVEYGTRYGQSGSLSAEFRDQQGITARQQRLLLEALRSANCEIYLRNPFGDVWAVALASARLTRTAGVGRHEMTTVAIDYTEITA